LKKRPQTQTDNQTATHRKPPTTCPTNLKGCSPRSGVTCRGKGPGGGGGRLGLSWAGLGSPGLGGLPRRFTPRLSAGPRSGAAPARNPRFHGDPGPEVPFLFFLSPLLFLWLLGLFFYGLLILFSLRKCFRRPPPAPPRGNQLRVCRGCGGRGPRPPRGEGPTRGRSVPWAAGEGFPQPLGPTASPPRLVQGQKCGSGRAGGESIATRERGGGKKKEKEKKKEKIKVDSPAGLGGESPLRGVPAAGIVSPRGMRRGAGRPRAPGRRDCPGLCALLPRRPRASPSLPRTTRRNTAAGTITARFNYRDRNQRDQEAAII